MLSKRCMVIFIIDMGSLQHVGCSSTTTNSKIHMLNYSPSLFLEYEVLQFGLDSFLSPSWIH